MLDIDLFREAASVFARGENVCLHFGDRALTSAQKMSIVEYAYDLQSGSYVSEIRNNREFRRQKQAWGAIVAEIIDRYGASSVIEAGVGEATTLKFVIDHAAKHVDFGGFDLSISRLAYARAFLAQSDRSVDLFAGDLSSLPIVDNAVDVILTNHSIEPNGGREREILTEMLRATRRLLVLIEPDYEHGTDQQRMRMDRLSYVRDLPRHLEALGAKILEYEPWEININPLNSAYLIVAEKAAPEKWNQPSAMKLASPFSKELLELRPGYLYSEADGVIFPIVEGIPCLLQKNAIVASHLSDSARRRIEASTL
jgi:uncharacterized protein YbaR (Trm112 family)